MSPGLPGRARPGGGLVWRWVCDAKEQLDGDCEADCAGHTPTETQPGEPPDPNDPDAASGGAPGAITSGNPPAPGKVENPPPPALEAPQQHKADAPGDAPPAEAPAPE